MYERRNIRSDSPITTYQTTQEVIERANNSPYGLAAYIFTQDLSEAIEISGGLEYGIVGLNDGVPSTAQAPIGGFKESGLGREGGHWGIEEYLEQNTSQSHSEDSRRIKCSLCTILFLGNYRRNEWTSHKR